MVDIEKLKSLALAATPGPWDYREVEGLSAIAHPLGWVLESGDEQECADKRFIAASNPATVLELIAEVERLRAATAAGTAKVAERPDFFKWWASVEPRSRKAMLASAHRDTEKLHALLRMAFDAAIEAHNKAESTPCGS